MLSVTKNGKNVFENDDIQEEIYLTATNIVELTKQGEQGAMSGAQNLVDGELSEAITDSQ